MSFDLSKLKEPFPESEIEWRVQRSGVTRDGKPWAMVLAYVDARAVQDRLDAVVGPENWKDEYSHIEGGIICKLSIKVNNEWVTKENGSPETKVEAFKGGISKALVRAASTWGIGRYLYSLTEAFALISDKKVDGAKMVEIDGKRFYWKSPGLPAWALPKPVVLKNDKTTNR